MKRSLAVYGQRLWFFADMRREQQTTKNFLNLAHEYLLITLHGEKW